ncbi:hypothetical protein PAAG_01909 [Paracoccidioides lutzii Pb01]|uniref:Uncharacterized protein n=1 Tax=Paracoccidioides lutzii (strain ATCC MYA-826 / Pb01) TaxID=502779 RepID=C1GTR4_PARBA|nr:hypothetical protein PAAG_01909 [Paracoccidioides lutzii Pb01]EEH39720.2 hypothetical protein PAAG_01909 [Paracoccidioides lutzii Pb01]
MSDVESSADRKLSATPAQACGAGLWSFEEETDLSADLGSSRLIWSPKRGLADARNDSTPTLARSMLCSLHGGDRKKRLRDELVDTAHSYPHRLAPAERLFPIYLRGLCGGLQQTFFNSSHQANEFERCGTVSLQKRIRNTYGAYHWGVLLAPKKSNGRDNMAYDVSDGVRLDNETGQDLNSERDWSFRIKNLNSVGQWAAG